MPGAHRGAVLSVLGVSELCYFIFDLVSYVPGNFRLGPTSLRGVRASV